MNLLSFTINCGCSNTINFCLKYYYIPIYLCSLIENNAGWRLENLGISHSFAAKLSENHAKVLQHVWSCIPSDTSKYLDWKTMTSFSSSTWMSQRAGHSHDLPWNPSQVLLMPVTIFALIFLFQHYDEQEAWMTWNGHYSYRFRNYFHYKLWQWLPLHSMSTQLFTWRLTVLRSVSCTQLDWASDDWLRLSTEKPVRKYLDPGH